MINLELNRTLINKFNRDGFIILDEFINRNFIENLKSRFEPLFKGKFETGIKPDEWNWKFEKDPVDVTRQICNGWKSDISDFQPLQICLVTSTGSFSNFQFHSSGLIPVSNLPLNNGSNLLFKFSIKFLFINSSKIMKPSRLNLLIKVRFNSKLIIWIYY